MVPDRASLLTRCRASLAARRAEYLAEIAALDAAAAGETKSSAGDKYETAREMIAQSRNLAGRTLEETEASLLALDRMAAAPVGPRVGFGSLVETSAGWFLVGASLGEVEAGGGLKVRTLSLASPLGQTLKGRALGERVEFRGSVLEILSLAP